MKRPAYLSNQRLLIFFLIIAASMTAYRFSAHLFAEGTLPSSKQEAQEEEETQAPTNPNEEVEKGESTPDPERNEKQEESDENGEPTEKPKSGDHYKYITMQWLTTGLLLFASLVFLLMAWLIRAKNVSPEAVLRCFGTPLIVLSAVLLVIAGTPKDDFTPIVGLLGTIAGYLLGRTARPGGEMMAAPGDPPKDPKPKRSKE